MARNSVVSIAFFINSRVSSSMKQASGTARPSFTTSLIEDAIKEGRLAEEEDDILNAAGALYGGAHFLLFRSAID